MLKYGDEVNAKDSYEYTAMDRLASNSVAGSKILKDHGVALQGTPLYLLLKGHHRGLGRAI